ncbi:unnamed protein product [Lymnaea stagnalis]|uniref:Translation elongation factor EFTs/EF1B dimerisation domain-containing protein n=1 Tax=Lymnaea stagnalis TaxID=6523 RepID=A0AAV2IKQ5_LYMST
MLASYIHPSNSSKSQKSVLLGKYGSIVEMKKNNKVEKPVMSLNDLSSHICQHIVGMNPKTVCEYIPRENKKPVEEKRFDEEDIFNEDGSSEAAVQMQVEVEEDKLLNQEFLLDTTMTVGELVSINGVEILQFRRFACGEEVEGEAKAEQ